MANPLVAAGETLAKGVTDPIKTTLQAELFSMPAMFGNALAKNPTLMLMASSIQSGFAAMGKNGKNSKNGKSVKSSNGSSKVQEQIADNTQGMNVVLVIIKDLL